MAACETRRSCVIGRPIPTYVAHFTHVDNLAAIARNGLLADGAGACAELLVTDIGNQQIKAARRRRAVPVRPGGVVADYVPFYFASRSPMMFAIDRGNVPTYTRGCDDIVYLVTSIERMIELSLSLVFTDRNAVLAIASFATEVEPLDDLVDWRLMGARMWNNTPDEPDRMEKRMAECLAHGRVPWSAFLHVIVKNAACELRARQALATVNPQAPVAVRPAWYF